MVESPTATAYFKTGAVSDEANEPLILADEKASTKEPELLLVKARPITAKFRTTIQHLRARAGPFSRFRGLQVVLIYGLLHTTLTTVLVGLIPVDNLVVPYLSAVISAVLLARLPLTWTHVVISEPSDKKWYRRRPGFKSWVHIAPATAIWATAEQLTVALPHVLFQAFGLDFVAQHPGAIGKIDEASRNMIVGQSFAVFAVAVGTALLILIPATVTLRRVQASLLPEDDEAIVPFDRTFGGKVVPEIVGGSGKLGIIDAWRSFEWAARFRVVKVYVKVFTMQTGLTLLFAGVLFAELQLIMGEELQKMIMVQASQNGEILYEIRPVDN